MTKKQAEAKGWTISNNPRHYLGQVWNRVVANRWTAIKDGKKLKAGYLKDVLGMVARETN